MVNSKYLKSDLFKHSQIQELIIRHSRNLNLTLDQIQTDSLRIIETYKNASWPADNLVLIASINNDSIQQKWIELLLKNSQHKSDLINHTDSRKTQVRGSSSALISYCLKESNYHDISSYNEKFEDLFIDSYLGIQMVKENEDGSNEMDYDSGPVVFGYGAAATIMNIKTQGNLENQNAKATWALINLISLPINLFKKKYLIFKKEPMLDLFVLWASTDII